MSECKYTPGKWTIGDVSKTLVDTADGKRKGRLAVSIHHPGNLSWPLMRIGASSDDDLEEVMANARLVVAGKDMLAALEDVIRVADRKTPEFDKARAAVAKAKGVASTGARS